MKQKNKMNEEQIELTLKQLQLKANDLYVKISLDPRAKIKEVIGGIKTFGNRSLFLKPCLQTKRSADGKLFFLSQISYRNIYNIEEYTSDQWVD